MGEPGAPTFSCTRETLTRRASAADTSGMDGAAPISPELVLVYPEMREQAIALLPDFGWQTFVARARVLAQVPAEESAPGKLSPREVVALTPALLSLATWMVIAFAGATLLTLVLTLYADAVR